MLGSILEAILLGIVQGLTEFIPVSSSAHLVLVPYLFGLEQHGLAFDVALHVGTFGAVLVFFRAELLTMIRAALGRDRSPDGLVYRRVALLAAAGSVPVAVVGFALEDVVADAFSSPFAAASFLFVTAALLFAGERIRDYRVKHNPVRVGAPEGRLGTAPDDRPTGRHELPLGRDAEDPQGTTLDRMTLRSAVIIGLGQCVALFPGISRSGTTIVTGMATGMTREAATRFSFLLALPALFGAALVSLDELTAAGRTFSYLDIAVGIVSGFVSGYLAIRFLIALVARDRLTGFAWYCAGAGAIGLLVIALRG